MTEIRVTEEMITPQRDFVAEAERILVPMTTVEIRRSTYCKQCDWYSPDFKTLYAARVLAEDHWAKTGHTEIVEMTSVE